MPSGTYISQTDIENVFGSDNVERWSNLQNLADAADTTRIQAAIDTGEQQVEDRFRGSKWSLPLTGDGVTLYVVKDWCAKLAGIWLYESRGMQDDNDEGNKLSDMKDDVHADIGMYLSGQKKLSATEAHTDVPEGPTVVM